MTWIPQGMITGAMTPLTGDDQIDWESLNRHVHQLADSGATALLVNASMAEGGHLSTAERDEILAFVIREVGEQIPVINTIYGSNTSEAAAEAGRASAAGARGLLIYPHPAFGGRPLDPAVPAGHFRAIWRSAGLPMVAFRTPVSLAPTLDLESLKRLSDVPGVAAVKDSAGDMDFYTHGGNMFLVPDSPLKILADHDPLILEYLRAGAHGATVISSVVDPRRYVDLVRKWDSAAADAEFDQLGQFARVVYEAPFRDFRARLKEALRADGIFATAHVRPPLLPLSAAERYRIVTALEASRQTAA